MLKRMRLFLAVGLLMLTAIVSAQVTTSSMAGRVTSEGETVIGATVLAIHEPSGTRYGAITNVDGRFALQGMRTGGPYSVEISFVGYQTALYKDITLQLGETYSLNVDLRESSELIDEVVVVGNRSKFTAEKTGASTNITPDQLKTLPSINRSIEDFTRLSPYAAGSTFGGRDGRSNTFTVDGANLNNNFGLSSGLPGGGNPISIDAIEEIQVVIAPFDVRQANFIGAGVNAITKSGTNEFKGTAYTYQYNQNMRGNKVDGTSLGKREKDSKSIYGFTFGGPIIKNKLFFFTNVEYEKTPGQITEYRAAGGGGLESRTKPEDLDRFSSVLKEKYGYNTGSYSNFPGGVENLKILGRIDWNINNANKFSVRYNYTKNDDWNPANGNSTDASLRFNNMNRFSEYSMSYYNSCYSLRNVVNSVTGELNSRINPSMSNQLLVTFTDINDTRGSNSDPFPFIDIMYGKDENGNQVYEPYMSAGYELFTWNNGVKNKVFSVVDNYTYYLGAHKITAGLSYEYQKALNSYMRNGTGYYRYYSLDDFINGAAPETVALTYGYNGELNPAAEVAFGQFAAYIQDEWNIRENFKLTAGLRIDNTTFLNDMMRNQAVYDTFNFNGTRVDTSVWPSSKVQWSPRAGFTWDIFNDKSLKLRGGSGLFTGRIPLVFFTNMPTNAGMIQRQATYTTTYKDGAVATRAPELDKFIGGLTTSVPQMIEMLGLPTNINPEDGAISSEVVGVDPDFKMPQVWKTSLALDYQVPVSFPLTVTVEGMYSKDINAVRQVNINVKHPDSSWERFNGPDNRYIYPSHKETGADGKETTVRDYIHYSNLNGAYYLTNTSKGWGWTGNITVTAEPVRNLNIMAAYTHTESKEISGLPGSNAGSAWQVIPSLNGPNQSKLMRSQYVTPDKVIASLSYRIPYLKNSMATTVGLFYTAFSPYGNSFTYTNDMNGDGLSNDLIYIPATKDEINFVSSEDRDAFWKFVEQDTYLKKHKGEYAEGYATRAPFVHRFDFRIAQDFSIKAGKTTNTLQVSLDILNVGNMFNSNWGVYSNMAASNQGQILKYEGVNANNVPTYSFVKDKDGNYLSETWSKVRAYGQCWKMQVGVRYIFN